jgi:RNA polymerase sigma factor (sigma-70 family)
MTSEPLAVDALAVDASAAIPAAVPAAVAASYQRRARQLWSYGRRLGLDPETAEETMQEAFARAAALLPGSVDELDAWLFRVVHNLAVDAHRRARRLSAVREIVPPSGDADADERLALWQEVDRLPERQRAVLYLRYRADLEFAAIASILGITEGGARANCARALDRLRDWMDPR